MVILDELVPPSATSGRYAKLPREGIVDTLPDKTRIFVLGYGIQDWEKDLGPGELFTRYYAPAELIQSSSPISDELLKVTANPSRGKGGTCFGASGGPILKGSTILGVNSFVTNSNRAGVTYSYRIDTAEALAFIRSVIGTKGRIKPGRARKEYWPRGPLCRKRARIPTAPGPEGKRGLPAASSGKTSTTMADPAARVSTTISETRAATSG